MAICWAENSGCAPREACVRGQGEMKAVAGKAEQGVDVVRTRVRRHLVGPAEACREMGRGWRGHFRQRCREDRVLKADGCPVDLEIGCPAPRKQQVLQTGKGTE